MTHLLTSLNAIGGRLEELASSGDISDNIEESLMELRKDIFDLISLQQSISTLRSHVEFPDQWELHFSPEEGFVPAMKTAWIIKQKAHLRTVTFTLYNCHITMETEDAKP